MRFSFVGRFGTIWGIIFGTILAIISGIIFGIILGFIFGIIFGIILVPIFGTIDKEKAIFLHNEVPVNTKTQNKIQKGVKLQGDARGVGGGIAGAGTGCGGWQPQGRPLFAYILPVLQIML